MRRFALVNLTTEEVVDERDFAQAIAPPDRSDEGVEWREVEVIDPPFDPATQVRSGPVREVLKGTVRDTYTVRDKTAEERAEEREQRIAGIDQIVFGYLQDLENRVRVLEGKPSVSKAQFAAAMKARAT